jgi:hypothetical protein
MNNIISMCVFLLPCLWITLSACVYDLFSQRRGLRPVVWTPSLNIVRLLRSSWMGISSSCRFCQNATHCNTDGGGFETATVSRGTWCSLSSVWFWSWGAGVWVMAVVEADFIFGLSERGTAVRKHVKASRSQQLGCDHRHAHAQTEMLCCAGDERQVRMACALCFAMYNRCVESHWILQWWFNETCLLIRSLCNTGKRCARRARYVRPCVNCVHNNRVNSVEHDLILFPWSSALGDWNI